MTVNVTARTYMVIGPEPELWYRDLVSCLQATFGSVLARAGADPLSVLGAGWRFLHRPGDVRSEEFYYPCPASKSGEIDLGSALAPHHELHSRWWQPADENDVWREVRETLADDRLVIAAVDNFHLPFRPAYGDVHAAHLVVVYGLDETRGVVYVSDAMPPAFRGAVRSRSSAAAGVRRIRPMSRIRSSAMRRSADAALMFVSTPRPRR